MSKIFPTLFVAIFLLTGCFVEKDQVADLECLDFKNDIDREFGISSQALVNKNESSCKYSLEISKEYLKNQREKSKAIDKYLENLNLEENSGEK